MEQKSNGMWLRIIDFIRGTFSKTVAALEWKTAPGRIIDFIRGTFSKIRGMIIYFLLCSLVILVVLHILLLIIMAFAFLAVQSGNYGIIAQQNFPINTDIDPISLIKIIVVLLAGIFVVGIFRDEDCTVIMPFETSSNTEKCSGKTISDLLIANLVEISHIQGAKYDEMRLKRNTKLFDKIGKEKLSSMSFSKGNLTGTSDFGTVVLGPTSFSLGQLLRILKQICPGNNSEMVITGSLQKYGNVISIVAIMEQKGTKAWEVRRSIKANNDIEYEYIYGMITDLAYKIFFDESKKGISAKSWSELKYITPALDSYQQYKLTGDIKILEKSHYECIRAASVNPGYEKPIKLLYNIAIAYWKKDKFYEAEKLFRQIVILEPNNIDAWEGWGIALRFFLLDKAAIKCCEKVLDKNPEPAMKAEIYCMKAISYRNLKKFDESIKCLETSLELNDKYGLAYQYLGQAYNLKDNKYLFCWDEIPENDNMILINFLTENFDIEWVKTAKIEKIDDDKTIKVSAERNSLSLRLNDEKTKVNIKINDGRTDELIAKTQNDKLNIYDNKIDKAIKAFENCGKYAKNLTLIHPSLARLYKNKGDKKKSDKHCKKAKNSLEGRTEYNRACYEVICGEKKKAFELFDIVFNEKHVKKKWIQNDPDLEFIRDDLDFKKGLDEYDDRKEDDIGIILSKAAIYRKLGLEKKDEVFMKVKSKLTDKDREYDCARYYAICTDNREKALELLREAIIKKQKSPEIALYDPDFEFISDDPRFQRLQEEFIEGQEIHSNTETIQLY